MPLLIDLSGRKSGKLTIIRILRREGKRIKWLCRCECGNEAVVAGDNLKNGHTKSCGCAWREKRPPKQNLAGKRFGMLVVKSFYGRKPDAGDAYWNCKCDCGGSSIVAAWNLKVGSSRSCGCQIRAGLRRANVTHGLTGTPEYKIWAGMITRCTNEKEFSYRYYGARGIKVCDRWTGEDGFKNFISDIGPRPSKGHSVERDRINDGYQPDNCRWATRLEQANNKQNTMRVMFDGKLTALKTVCQILNKDYKFVRYRMVRGYSFEDAITIPKNFRREEWQAGARQSA